MNHNGNSDNLGGVKVMKEAKENLLETLADLSVCECHNELTQRQNL